MKIWKAKENFPDSDGHNIFRIFVVLPKFLFTTMEKKHDY